MNNLEFTNDPRFGEIFDQHWADLRHIFKPDSEACADNASLRGLIASCDFWKLAMNADCVVEIAGSGQLGTLNRSQQFIDEIIKVTGSATASEFVERKCSILTVEPLHDGSAQQQLQEVWIDSFKLQDLARVRQFVMSQNELVVEELLRKCTFLSLEQISEIMSTQKQSDQSLHAREALSAALLEQLTNDPNLPGIVRQYVQEDTQFAESVKRIVYVVCDAFSKILHGIAEALAIVDQISLVLLVTCTVLAAITLLWLYLGSERTNSDG